MSYSPVVAFGLTALSVAMKAKCGRLGHRDKLALAMAVLRLMPEDPRLAGAVVAFLDTVERSATPAAEALLEFVNTWMDEVSPRAAAEVTAQAERAAPYDWQLRADLQ